MKKFLLLFSLLYVTSLGFSQVIIQSSDVYKLNEEFKYFQAEAVEESVFAKSGEDVSWDLSDLVKEEEEIVVFQDMSKADAIFAEAFGSDKANLRSPFEITKLIPEEAIPEGFKDMKAQTFFLKTEEELVASGYGVETTMGKVPLVFTEPDVLMDFPLNYNKMYNGEAHMDANQGVFNVRQRAFYKS